MNERPKIGVGVCIVKDNKVLLGLRKEVKGLDTWAFPGGHLEYGESPEDCAVRETEEETGIKIKNLKRAGYTNDIFQNTGKHYVTLFLLAEVDSGDVKLMEPDKCEKWEWFSWDDLPSPLFLPIVHLKEQGFNPY